MEIGSSSDSDQVLQVFSFDGQTVWYDRETPFFEVGNFLGGGAAGTVYECEHAKTHEHFALKILNPIGFKMVTPAILRKCTVMVKGKVLDDTSDEMDTQLGRDHVWWLANGNTKQFIGAYYSERHNSLKELSLSQCIQIYGTEPAGVGEDDSGDGDATVEIVQSLGGPRVYVPSVPPKYADFVRRRARIFREIRNMRKISTHVNVIRLEGVMELTQETKCTIFLVMELANGGELFDRIKIDYGTREDTAKYFFQQLLEGVRHCHEQGVCHRDLKPENLLLQDIPDNGTTLKIADFGFSARFAMENVSMSTVNWQQSQDLNGNSIRSQHALHAAPAPSMLAESPMRVLKSVVGSPFYVAPEVLQARGYDGPRADVWSLGVILYAMLAGNLPFGQELGTCKRFRHFCKWVRDNMSRSVRFWDDPLLEYPPWLFPAKFSIQAKGLIVSMLHPDPSCRITVLDAIAHPLCACQPLAEPAPNSTTMPPPIPEVVHVVNMINRAADVFSVDASNEPLAHQQAAHAFVTQSNVESMDCTDAIVSAQSKDMMEQDEREDNDDDDGGVFRMEEDGDSDNEREKSSPGQFSSSNGAPTPRISPTAQGSKASSYGTGYSFGSPSSQTSQSQYLAPPVAPTMLHSASVNDLIIGSDDENDAEASPISPGRSATSVSTNSSATAAVTTVCPPSFNDLVKRSTRFITAVPAAEVLEKVECVLEECRFQKTQTPIGLIGKIEMYWPSFRLEVWGTDVNGPPLCALQLYQLPVDLASATPTSPSRLLEMMQSDSGLGGLETATRQLILVEFVRGQLEIFAFKRFYQWVRQKVSELVKRDYSYKFLDSSASPMIDSYLLAKYQMGGSN